MNKPYKYLFKYIIVGDAGVGKSSLVLQFSEQRFINDYKVTIGADFVTKSLEVDNVPIKLHIWDTAGQEQFRSLTRSYYRNCLCALLVYDITNKQSFESIQRWLDEARNDTDSNVVMLLIGNKCDLNEKRQVSYEDAEKFAKANNMIFYEASAKTAQNILPLFNGTAKTILKLVKDGKLECKQESTFSVDLPNKREQSKGCCS